MQIKEITNNISSLKKTLTESTKTTIKIATLAGGLISNSACNHLGEEHVATLEQTTIQSTQSAIANIIHQYTPEIQIQGKCNFARIQLSQNDKPLKITAKHCLGYDEPERKNDIIITSNLSQAGSKITGVKTYSLETKSHTFALSPLKPTELENEIITIHSCYPDRNGDSCYKISGEPYYDETEGTLNLFLNPHESKKIYEKNTESDRRGFNGMSGSPVVDSQGRLVGVLTGASVYKIKSLGDKIKNKVFVNGNVIFSITPIRDEAGRLKIDSDLLNNYPKKTKRKKK